MNKFWQIVNKTGDDDAEILLYGDIASEKPWWSEGDTTTPKEFAEDLASLGGRPVTVRINSMGGDVFAAHAIYNQLRTYSGKVTVLIDSIAASAASIVAMAGNPVIMPSNTMMMIHNPMLELWGYYNTDDLAKMSAALDGIKESIVSAYMSKANLARDKVSKMMDESTWMTADKAKEHGLCDEVQDIGKALNAVINGNFMVINSVKHDLSRVKNAEQLKQMVEASNKGPDADSNPKNQKFSFGEIVAAAIQSLTPQNKKDDKEDKELDIKTIDDLKKAYPEMVNQIASDAVTNAAAKDKERVDALNALAVEGNQQISQLIEKAKNSGKTAADIQDAVDIMKQHPAAPAKSTNKGEDILAQAIKDSIASGVNGVTAEGVQGQGEAQEALAAINMMAGILDGKNKNGGKK